MGVAQGVSALARIFGPLISIPLFNRQPTLPYWTASGVMVVAMAIFILFARHGKDYAAGPVELSLPPEAL